MTETMDPTVHAAFEMLAALDDETAALDQLLLRCRATMLLASAGEFAHLQAASADLDVSSSALDAVSKVRTNRIERASAVWGVSAETAEELIAAAPPEFADEFRRRLEVQRGLLAEATEAVEVARAIAQKSLEVLGARRDELSTSTRPPLTYGSRGATPPARLQRLA